MLFYIIRITIWIILSCGCYFLIRKSKINRKKPALLLSVVLGGIVVLASVMFPVENQIMDFSTPEDVFYYINPNYEGIYGKVEGQNSCMLIYKDTNAVWRTLIVPKTEHGYSVPTSPSEKTVVIWNDQYGAFQIITGRNTGDYYAIVTSNLIKKESKLTLQDEFGTTIGFSLYITDDSEFAFFSVPDLDHGYYLTNGIDMIKITQR